MNARSIKPEIRQAYSGWQDKVVEDRGLPKPKKRKKKDPLSLEEKSFLLSMMNRDGDNFLIYGVGEVNIKNKTFHRLRKDFMKARRALREYIYKD